MTMYRVVTTGQDLTNNYNNVGDAWEFVRATDGGEVWEFEADNETAAEQLLNTDSSVISYTTDEKTNLEVLQISDRAPHTFGDNHRNAGYQEGIEIASWQRFEMFYACVQGIGPGGNWFEGDDAGPFASREQAITTVREQLEADDNDDRDIDMYAIFGEA